MNLSGYLLAGCRRCEHLLQKLFHTTSHVSCCLLLVSNHDGYVLQHIILEISSSLYSKPFCMTCCPFRITVYRVYKIIKNHVHHAATCFIACRHFSLYSIIRVYSWVHIFLLHIFNLIASICTTIIVFASSLLCC